MTISINPEEGPEVAKSKKRELFISFENPAFKDKDLKWLFWTSPDNKVKDFAQAIDFSTTMTKPSVNMRIPL
ncbi:MAG: hypothetical protein R3A45_04550 [Bdellovibrionota bacterium]